MIPATTIRLALVDDHPLMCDGIRRAVATEKDIEIVSEAHSAAEARRMLGETLPDVVLLDRRLPDEDGLDLLQVFTAAGVKVVMLTCGTEERTVREAIAAGACGFLSKRSVDAQTLADAVRSARTDTRTFSPEVMAALLSMARVGRAPDEPTMRERQVWELLSEGLTNAEIARKLYLSERTVKFHVGNILHKLGARTRAEATAMAYRSGVMDTAD